MSLVVALRSILLTSLLIRERERRRTNVEAPASVSGKTYLRSLHNTMESERFRVLLAAVFGIVLVASLIYRTFVIRFVFSYGYLAFYRDFPLLVRGSFWLFILSKIEIMLPGALSFYFVSSPPAKALRIVIPAYLIYAILTLLSGQRFPFVAALSLCLIYVVLRNQARILTARQKRALVLFFSVSLFVIVLIFYIMEFMRRTNQGILSNPLVSLISSQGVSFNVLQHGYVHRALLPAGRFYSLSFLFTGIPAIFSDTAVYQGNNIQNALLGHSYPHALAYVVNPDAYLSGVGFGSSYIAEAYHDFGYFGIVFWSVILAIVISRVNRVDKRHLYRNSLKLIVVAPILWAPRGETSGFLTTLIAPSNLLLYVGIGVLALFTNWYEKRYSRMKVDEAHEELH